MNWKQTDSVSIMYINLNQSDGTSEYKAVPYIWYVDAIEKASLAVPQH